MSIYQLKPKFQDLLRPFVRRLAAVGVTPNQVTVFTTLLSIATGIVLYANLDQKIFFLFIPVVLFIRMALNAMDGMLAREHNMQSSLGFVLNELGDVISDTALYLPFLLLREEDTVLMVLILVSSVVSEMAGLLGLRHGNRFYNGPMGKSDRAFVFGFLGLFLGLGVQKAGPWLAGTYALILILIFQTIINRAKRCVRNT